MPGLRVLSWRGRWHEALRTQVSDPFEHAFGVGVEHSLHGGLGLPGPLAQALEAGRVPPVDIVWSSAVPALQAAAAGHCVPLDPGRLTSLGGLHDRARPQGHADLPVIHPYVMHYVLGYRTRAFPGGPPGTWDVLLDARHRGRVALYPGGTGLYPIAQVMGGGDPADLPAAMDPCWSWLRRLSGSIGHLGYSTGMAGQLRNDLDLVFRALPSMLAFQEQGVPAGWTVPQEGTSDNLGALWIPRGITDERAAMAMTYIDFALLPSVQERWCAHLGTLPVHRDAAAPAILRDHPRLPGRADETTGILPLPEAVKARHQPAWEAEFERIFQGGTAG